MLSSRVVPWGAVVLVVLRAELALAQTSDLALPSAAPPSAASDTAPGTATPGSESAAAASSSELPRSTEVPPPIPPPPPPSRAPSRPIVLVPPDDTISPAPPTRRGPRVHDGFYLRLALGASYGRTFVETDRVSQVDVTVTGIGPSGDLWLGWTLAPGLVLGPALSTFTASTGGAKIGDDESAGSGSATGALLGAFIDAYPNPEDGYHFGGVLSLASLQQKTDSALDHDYQGGGVGLSIFAGYDAWIAREWSLGGLLRLGGVVTRSSDEIDGVDTTRQGTLYGAVLLFSAVHH